MSVAGAFGCATFAVSLKSLSLSLCRVCYYPLRRTLQECSLCWMKSAGFPKPQTRPLLTNCPRSRAHTQSSRNLASSKIRQTSASSTTLARYAPFFLCKSQTWQVLVLALLRMHCTMHLLCSWQVFIRKDKVGLSLEITVYWKDKVSILCRS